ncbi:MAG: TPM domain-containing protein [Burkholderiales bacterium]|nr:TPM domain-containing protein [Burkholderiales bacterium]
MATSLKRALRHLTTTDRLIRKTLAPGAFATIEQAIREGEAEHDGELRFAVEAALDIAPLFAGVSARQRAIDAFAQLRVWDTEQNNGVLIYLLLADHDFEIVADRGIDRHVGAARWKAICADMEQSFRRGDFEAGVIVGIREVSAELRRHFPARPGGKNELPDETVIL